MSDKQSPAQPQVVQSVPFEVYRTEQALAAQRMAAEMEMDETVEGGQYQVGDRLVDANGEPVKESKSVAKADEK